MQSAKVYLSTLLDITEVRGSTIHCTLYQKRMGSSKASMHGAAMVLDSEVSKLGGNKMFKAMPESLFSANQVSHRLRPDVRQAYIIGLIDAELLLKER